MKKANLVKATCSCLIYGTTLAALGFKCYHLQQLQSTNSWLYIVSENQMDKSIPLDIQSLVVYVFMRH